MSTDERYERYLRIAEIVRGGIIDQIEERRPNYQKAYGRSVAMDHVDSGSIWNLALRLQVEGRDDCYARIKIISRSPAPKVEIAFVCRVLPTNELRDVHFKELQLTNRHIEDPRLTVFEQIAEDALTYAYGNLQRVD